MNPASKKFISLFLVFSLMMLSVNLYAKERRGANIIITKKNDRKIEGELIAVKWNSLLILSKWSGRDESVDIADVKAITIVKKSKVGRGALYGASLGGLGSAVFILISLRADPEDYLRVTVIFAVIGAAIGGLLGTLIGSAMGIHYVDIQIEEMSDSEIQKTLKKLRKKARVRDYK